MRTEREQQLVNAFTLASRNYLDSIGTLSLRAYGRYVGVARATAKKKPEIIEEIIAIFVGDLQPIERSKRGAPVKDDSFDPQIEAKMNAYRFAYLNEVSGSYNFEADNGGDSQMDWGLLLKTYKNRPSSALMVSEIDKGEYKDGVRRIHQGQLATLNGVSFLLPLNCVDTELRVLISVEFIREFGLQEGDILSCYATRNHNVYVAIQILQINGIDAEHFNRTRLDMAGAQYPSRELKVYEKGRYDSTTHKFMQWLIPFGKGQRALVVSPPKCGKTQLLLSMAEAIKALNEDVELYALLVDQSPETVGAFRRVLDEEHLLYTTYDDNPDRQVFVASFILKRAVCQVESGRDVVLILDSFNALARAYNDTEESSGGKLLANGLESKTIHFIKKYFGVARQTEKVGSLTILGGASVSTGNPADDMIAAELSSLGNLEIQLSDQLTRRRIFPAFDLGAVYTKQDEQLRTDLKDSINLALRQHFLTKFSAEDLLDLINSASSIEELYASIKKLI